VTCPRVDVVRTTVTSHTCLFSLIGGHWTTVRHPSESRRRIDDSTPAYEPQRGVDHSYIDGFRAYEPLDEGDAFDREYVIHSDSE